VGAVLGLSILYAGGGLVAYCLAFNVVAVIPIVANAWQLWPELRRERQFDRSIWREVLRGGFPFFMLSMMLAIFASVDVLLLEIFADSDTVGWYSLAYRWISLPAFFAAAVATAFFPALAAEGVTVSEAFCRMADRALHVVLFVAVPCAIGIALIADDFINTLYGEEFANAVPLMRILAIGFPIVALDMILGTVAISADRQRKWTIYSGIAVVFNIGVNIVAIPLSRHWFDNAAIGAAVTTVLTELLLANAALRLRPAGVFQPPAQVLAVRIGLASVAMIPVVLLLDGLPMLVKAAAGAATYVVASCLLRTISVDELRALTSRAGERSSADVQELGATR
jgi:O-antigen/teichoic acid export membrane protein